MGVFEFDKERARLVDGFRWWFEPSGREGCSIAIYLLSWE